MLNAYVETYIWIHSFGKEERSAFQVKFKFDDAWKTVMQDIPDCAVGEAIAKYADENEKKFPHPGMARFIKSAALDLVVEEQKKFVDYLDRTIPNHKGDYEEHFFNVKISSDTPEVMGEIAVRSAGQCLPMKFKCGLEFSYGSMTITKVE